MLPKSLMAVLLVLAALLAACKVDPPSTPKPAISLSASGASIVTGQTSGQLRVSITRTNYTGEVTVEAQSATSGISVTSQKTTADSVTLPVTLSSSVAKGDHPLTIRASGQGLETAQAQVMLTVSDTTPPPPPPPPGIRGKIQNWNGDTVTLKAYSFNSLSSETLGRAEVGEDGLLEMELAVPTTQQDLDSVINENFCGGAGTVSSSPSALVGSFMFSLYSAEGDLEVLEQSYPASESPEIDGDVFLFRAYSADVGTLEGNCGSGFGSLQFDVSLAKGWNLLAATYNKSSNTFTVKSVSETPKNVKLYWHYLDYNDYPVATSSVTPYGYNQVFVDASYSYDPDGYISYYTIDMGDGTVYSDYDFGGISNAYFYHTYYSSGYYTITLTVYDDSGDSSSTSQEIYVYY